MWWLMTHDVSWIMGLYQKEIRTWNFEEEERSRAIHMSHTRGANQWNIKCKNWILNYEWIPRNSFFYQLRYSPKWAVPLAAISEALLYFHGDPLLRFHTLSTLQSSDYRFVSICFLSFLFLVPFNSITDCFCFTEIKSYEPG